ncbi:MAG: hypothetical protein ACJA09_003157 [Alcanivorax sp.]|jgi:hypothetical protein
MSKILGRRGIVTGIGFCITGMLGPVVSSFAFGEQVTKEKFEMQVIEYSAGGKEIVAGDYSAAIEALNGRMTLDSKYAKGTNLCVALTMQGEFSAAEGYCQAAKSSSRRQNDSPLDSYIGGLNSRDKEALALNNLGVHHALNGNLLEAQECLEIAVRKGGRYANTSERNMRALEQRMALDVVASR